MEFVNPGFLYGLSAVAIPVIIHLFNFRRFRKVYFTNVSIIRELKQETRKQSKLKHLLVLLARILAIAALVIAFARPYIPVKEGIVQVQENHVVSIFIDNSFSMMQGVEKGTLLGSAKEKAIDIAGIYKNSDRLQILTNDFEGKHQRLINRDDFPQWVDEIKETAVVKSISEVMGRQKDILNSADARVKTAYIISDFQKGFLDKIDFSNDSLINYYLIPLHAENTNNLYIDSIWFDAPVQQQDQLVKLKARINNSGSNDLQKIPVKLTVDGFQKSLASIDIGPGQSKELVLPYTNPGAGIHQGLVELNDHPVIFDDAFYFSYPVSELVKVLCINGSKENTYLNSLFRGDSTFKYENISEGMVEYSAIREYDMVILNEPGQLAGGLIQTLLKFIENGGTVTLIPSGNADLTSYNELLEMTGKGRFQKQDTLGNQIDRINLEHPVYADVFDEIPENIDLPLVNKSYEISLPARSDYEVLLRMQNGNPFLCVIPYGSGKIYLFASPFDTKYTNFVRHAIFVPTLYKISLTSLPVDRIYYTIGKNDQIRVKGIGEGNETPLKIVSSDGNFEVIPENKPTGGDLLLYPKNQINKAGNYFVTGEDGQHLKGVAFNYNRAESEMVFDDRDAIENWIADQQLGNIQILQPQDEQFSRTLTDLNRGVQLWKWFVMAALLFFLAEVLLLRFQKG